MTQKVEISSAKSLRPGDRIELHYKLSGPDWTWYKATLIAMIESKAANNENFRIYSSRFEGDRLILTVDIVSPVEQEPQTQQAGVVTTAAVIAALSLVVGGISWLLLDKVYQLTDSPGGQIAVAGTGLGLGALGLAAVAFVLLGFFKGAKA